MILVDVNLLVYAVCQESPEHARAQAWLQHTLRTCESVAMPWIVLSGFFRVATNRRVFNEPLTPEQALHVMDYWLAQPNVWKPEPTRHHFNVLMGLCHIVRPTGNQVPDAHLATLAMCHHLELNSADRGFSRYPGLAWRNPLADAA